MTDLVDFRILLEQTEDVRVLERPPFWTVPKVLGVFATLARLRRFHPQIRVLLLAGMPLKIEEEKARAEGARGYLSKNMDWARLVAAICLAVTEGEFLSDDFKETPVGPLSLRERDVFLIKPKKSS